MINKILTILTLPVFLTGGQGGTTRTTRTTKHAEKVTATTDESLNNWAIDYFDGETSQIKVADFATDYERYSTENIPFTEFSFIDHPGQYIQLNIDYNYYYYVNQFKEVYGENEDIYPGVLSIDFSECPSLGDFEVQFDLSGEVDRDYHMINSDSVLFIDTNVFANKGIESPNGKGFNLYFREWNLEYNADSYETARELQDLASTWKNLKIDFYKPKCATHINDKPFVTDKVVDLYIDSSNFYTAEQILSQVECVDLFGNDCYMELVSSDLKNVAGSYTIVARATDNYEMTAYLTINAKVVDYAPTIRPVEGATNQVIINYSSYVTSADILKLYTATDYLGSPLKVAFKSGTKFNTSKIGETTYTLVAKDAQNRISEYPITVNVVNDIPPLILLSDSIIFCDVHHPFNLVELQQAIIMSSGFKADEVEKVEINEPSEAIKNLSKVGQYSINYTIKTKDGQVRSGVLKTNVIEEPVAKKTWWTALCEWFTKLWNWICGKGWTL